MLLDFSKKQPWNDVAKMSDEEVFSLSQKDPQYFAPLVDRYQDAFVRKAIGILKNKDDAYDVVQETFVRIYAGSKTFVKKEGASFKSWAYTILINQCCTLYQKKKRASLAFFDLDEEWTEYVPDKAQLREHEQKLTREYTLSLVSRLPTLLKKMVMLHFIDDIPQKEIAEAEGVPSGVIRARIHRAKQELRKISLKFL